MARPKTNFTRALYRVWLARHCKAHAGVLCEYQREIRAVQRSQRFSGHFVYSLYQAASWADIRIVSLHLDYDADVIAVGGAGGTALHAALLYDMDSPTRVVLMELLLEAGADIEADPGHGTPLYCVALEGNVDGLHLLLDHGAQANAKSTGKRETALGAAIFAWKLDIVKLLLERSAKDTNTEGLLVGPGYSASKIRELEEILSTPGYRVNKGSEDTKSNK